jgi:pilus assembly protein CpaC
MRPQQVMLAVRFVEASRNADRELGINWNVVAKNVNVTTGAALAGNTAPFGVLLAKLIGNGVEVDSMIQALEARGLVRLLAEPNLIALSGDTASFLAGGEFPFPVGSTNNGGNITITVAWKRYGVGLAFTPTVRENGVINLKIEPEVSQLDPNNGFEIDGVKLPSLTVRRANTTIELRDGQSFAIAGLLQTVSKTDQKQLPWLGEVPVLGTLFRSTAYQKQETDLAIIVTPHLVRPARPGDELKTPLDASVAGNDADLFIDGRAELTPREVREVVPAARTVKPLGHILDLPKGAS